MANDLKRVGLIFTEEGAVDFKKTLQDINLELNKNYNQFKLTQAQWDSSTKSTEKLKAQQEYLTNAYEIQQDKVATLKMQLADLENAEDKNTTAIKKKRNELTNAEIKLEDYNNKLKDIEKQLNNSGKKIEEFGTKIENVGGKIENAGKKVSAFSLATGTALVASAKSAIEFESAFTGVEKTVDGTEQQMAELKQGIRDMAKDIPSSTTEISAVAEAAGQLGIKTEDILSFTKVMIDLGNSTNLSAEEAASALAKFANITNMSAQDYSKLGATIVDLGNNFATTEADIVEMATRLAATGELAGLSQAQILALATAMSSVGIEAEAGGSAMSKLLKQIQVAVETGSDDLKDFAKVAGMSSSEFKKAFEQDAVKALSAFISGLNDTERNGKSAIVILEEMGLTEVRLSNTVLSLANASNVMTDAIDTASTAWEDNTALTNEANKRYDTLESKIKICINKLKDFAITIGNKLMPSIEKIVDKIGDFAEWLSKLSDEQVESIVNIGLMVTAIGPLLTIIGKLTSTTGTVIKSIGTFTQAVGVVKGTVTTTSTAVNGLAGIIGGLTSPVGLAVTAIGSLIAMYTAHHIAVTQEKAALGGLREEVESQNESWKALGDTRNEVLSENLSEIENTSRLAEELKRITDENGKVKQGYEDRAQVILNQLNSALDTEYTLNGNIINQYQDLKSNIDELIEKKKAEAVLNAYQEEYETAIKGQSEATQTLIGLKQKLAEAAEQMATGNAKERKEAEILYSSIAQQIGEQTELIGQYGKTISDYDNLRTASVSGNAQQIQEATQSMMTSYEEIKQASEQTIEEQINTQTEYLNLLKTTLAEAEATNNQYQQNILSSQLETEQQKLVNLIDSLVQQTSTIEELTPEQIQAWKNIVDISYTEYSKGLARLPEETRNEIQEATGIIATDTGLSNAARTQGNNSTILFGQNLKIADEAREQVSESSNVFRNDTTVQNEAGSLAGRAETAVANNNSQTWGSDMVEGLGKGIRNKGNSNWFTNILSGLASKISSYLHFSRPDTGPLREYEKWMPDMVEGLGRTLEKSSPKLISKVKNMSEEMSEELKNINYGTPKNTNVNSNTNTIIRDIDYDKMSNAMLKALTNCKFTLDEDGFAKIVKDELYKVV